MNTARSLLSGFRPIIAVTEWTWTCIRWWFPTLLMAVAISTLVRGDAISRLVVLDGLIAPFFALFIAPLVGLLVVGAHLLFGPGQDPVRRDHAVVVGAIGLALFVYATTNLSRFGPSRELAANVAFTVAVIGGVNLAATGMRYRYLETDEVLRTGGAVPTTRAGDGTTAASNGPHQRMNP